MLRQLDGQPLPHRVVEHGIARIVCEIGKDDGVFVGEQASMDPLLPEKKATDAHGKRDRGGATATNACAAQAARLTRGLRGRASLQPREITTQVGSRGIPARRFLFEEPADDPFQCIGDRRIPLTHGPRRFVQ